MKLSSQEKFATCIYLVPADDELKMLSAEMADYALNTQKFSGKQNENYYQIGPYAENVVVVGLGESAKLTRDNYVNAAYKAVTILEDKKVQKATLKVNTYGPLDDSVILEGIVEGLLQASYIFEAYKSEKTTQHLEHISILSEIENQDIIIEETENILNGVNLTRDLVNTPANDLYPETLAKETKDAFAGTAVEVEIFDKEALVELGAEAILAVAQGSAKEPRMIVLKYMPLGDEQPVISLVGKGVTYDSGGYAIKNAGGMATMMTDMAGAAAMIGTIKALADNNIQQNVVAIIGATENLISGEAFKNGDIINTLKGSTVEVMNTDAEGRLVLADVLYYAATEFNSKYIIDAATLTGAVIAALGSNITGVLTNNEELLDQVLAASKLVGEDMWQLPITDEFKEKIKGVNADLANIVRTPSGTGTISAAAFLEHFVEDVPWVHLDIAGTSYASSKGNKYLPQGASGIPVKTLYQFIKNQ